jgi:hypothetical protein
VIHADHRCRDWAGHRDWDHRVHRSSLRRDANRGSLRRRHRDATSDHRDVTADHRVGRSSVVGRPGLMVDQWRRPASGVERPAVAVLVDRLN